MFLAAIHLLRYTTHTASQAPLQKLPLNERQNESCIYLHFTSVYFCLELLQKGQIPIGKGEGANRVRQTKLYGSTFQVTLR